MAIKEEQHDPSYEESSSSGTHQSCSLYLTNKQGLLKTLTAFIQIKNCIT